MANEGASVADWAGIITAFVSLAGAGGAALRWVWNKIERRFAEVDAELDKCRQREEISLERRAVHVTVIELLWQEIKRLSGRGNNDTLARAEKLLGDLKSKAKEHG